MILPDVNVLVYAFRREAEGHERYAGWLRETLASSPVALVESVLVAVVRIVTNPRIMADPAPTPIALSFVDALQVAPRARWLSPTPATWRSLTRFAVRDAYIRGNLVPDAWLAALAVSHGCRVATADRGFARFRGLDWFTPVDPSAEPVTDPPGPSRG